MSANSKLQSAVHLALGLSAGAFALSLAPNAMAQNTQDEDAEWRRGHNLMDVAAW